MEPAARPSVIAGVAFAAAGIIAAAPVVTPQDLQVRDIRLAAGWQDVLDAQLSVNSSLINALFGVNGGLVDVQHQLTPGIATLLGADVHADGSVHGLAKDAVEQFFDANNAVTGANQAALLGLLGARGTVDDGGFTPLDLAGLNESLLVDPRHVGSIPFAGLESALGHYLGSAVFLSAALNGTPESEVETNPTADSFVQVVADLNTFNQAILDAEKVFNTDLVAGEVDLEQALFGTDSAYNGVINRVFNAVNMMFDAQQQSFNGLLGLTGYDPQGYTDALLISGGSADGLDDGGVGGLLGIADHSLAALTALGGLVQGASTGVPDGFAPDPTAVADAVTALMGTLGGGPFGDVFTSGGAFSELLADLQSLFTSAAGS